MDPKKCTHGSKEIHAWIWNMDFYKKLVEEQIWKRANLISLLKSS
jgi:hypothetical protein